LSILTLYVLALVIGMYMAWNIGANDVANSMGTSVGSKAITLKQAVIIAAIFEFGGAFLAGAGVTDTMRKGILDADFFLQGDAHTQYLFILGMFAALFASAIWLNLATYMGWPVSTTHSIVGGIAGAGLVSVGAQAVHWGQLASIASSWVISPFVGALLSAGVYLLMTRLLIAVPDKATAVKRWAPVLLMPIFSVLSLVLTLKGLKNISWAKDFGIGLHASFALCFGLVVSFAVKAPITRFIDRNTQTNPEFDPAEGLFKYLQVVTACFVAFAHGSNDVANAIGPMAAIRDYYVSGGQLLDHAASVPPWLLALGGLGIVIGLATYGYKVIETVGEKVTELIPTRGFAAEFGAALTILVGSFLGLPLSTTHTLVGAILGVGLMRGIKHVDFGTLKKIAASWIITLPFASALSMLIMWLLMLI
jgi:PiT family inorganic phosphate transporter